MTEADQPEVRCPSAIADGTGGVVRCQRRVHDHVHWAEGVGMWSDEDERIVVEDYREGDGNALHTLRRIREWIGQLTQPIPVHTSTITGFRQLVDKLRFVETAWQQAVNRYMEYERLAQIQRQRADASFPLTGDLDGEALVLNLLSPGHVFSQVEDYGLALDWAVRAYRAGLAGQTLADVVNGSSFACGGFNCPCNDYQPCPDRNCTHVKGEAASATAPAPLSAS